jgi:hypothetical protein
MRGGIVHPSISSICLARKKGKRSKKQQTWSDNPTTSRQRLLVMVSHATVGFKGSFYVQAMDEMGNNRRMRCIE